MTVDWLYPLTSGINSYSACGGTYQTVMVVYGIVQWDQVGSAYHISIIISIDNHNNYCNMYSIWDYEFEQLNK